MLVYYIYIKEICKRVSEKTVWYLNEFDRDKFPDFRRKIRGCGFKGIFEAFNLKKNKWFGRKGVQITQMEDKILKTKGEMDRIYKIKHLTCEEKYDLASMTCDDLNEKELRILIKTCKRECTYYDKQDETSDLINSFPTIVAVLVAIAAIYFQQNEMSDDRYNNLIYCIGGVGCVLIIFNWKLRLYTRKVIKKLQYIIDILEDKYEEKTR